ncbi:MAG TPA: CPBP family intramembrane glutamic endopeptidase, partial [Chryseosolibacter sp.]
MTLLREKRYLSFGEAVFCVLALVVLALVLRKIAPYLYDNLFTYPLVTIFLLGTISLAVVKIKKLDPGYLFRSSKYDRSIGPFLCITISFFLLSRIALDVEDLLRLGSANFFKTRGEWIYNLSSRKGIHFITIVAVAPVMEEILFRGVFLRSFLTRYSIGHAVVLSSLLFAILHTDASGSYFSGFLSSLLSGAFFALVLVRTDSLKLAIVCHVFWNLLNYILPLLVILLDGRVHTMNNLIALEAT